MILVTGGTGFLGSYIIKALVEKGYPVRAIHRHTSRLPFFIPAPVFDKVEWVEGDVLDVLSLEEAMEGIDQVIHSAAVVSFIKSERKMMYQVNVDGTANVVNMALQKNVRRFVHISSIAALGRTSDGSYINEEKKWQDTKTNTHYAKSKYRGELEVWRGIGEGLNAVIASPSTVLGYGDWHNSSCAIFQKVYEEFRWYSTGINGFVDVEDTAEAVIRLMESDISGQRFIVSAENMSFKTLLETIADGFGKKRPARKITPFLVALAWRLEAIRSFVTGKKPVLTEESTRVAESKTYFKNDKLLGALPGFSFSSLEKSIQAACQKYLAGPK